MAPTNKETHAERIKKLRSAMTIGYNALIIVVFIILCAFIIGRTSSVMENKVEDLTSALNVQLKLNIQNYLSKMETTGTLIFATPEVYEYDALNPTVDEYEALNIEDKIGDKLMELCNMENYVDFGIVYRNNHTTGKISNGTINLFGDKLYSELESIITRERTNDGWAAGCFDDYKRIYYVKQVNENTLFVASFYTYELANVFVLPEDMEDMTVRLVSQENDIIYSSDENEIGTKLPQKIVERVDDYSYAAVMDDEYLVTINNCGDSWRVISTIPKSIILNEMNDIQLSTTLIACAVAVLAIVFSCILSSKLTNPVNTMVTDLDTKARLDRLTGINNKRAFEEEVEQIISDGRYIKRKGVLLIIDVDNFKGVNDNLGHSYGDLVLANIGNILRNTFRSTDCLGRIGGDEFAVYISIDKSEEKECMNIITSKCEALCEAFRNNYTGDDNNYKISASIGASITPDHGSEFETLYKCADKALYCSKEKGKDTYTIYDNSLQEAGEPDET